MLDFLGPGSPRWHRVVGLVLGFPECCVDEWVRDLGRTGFTGSATVRGKVEGGERTEVERAHLNAIIGPDFMGGEFVKEGDRKLYVPCVAHMHGER